MEMVFATLQMRVYLYEQKWKSTGKFLYFFNDHSNMVPFLFQTFLHFPCTLMTAEDNYS